MIINGFGICYMLYLRSKLELFVWGKWQFLYRVYAFGVSPSPPSERSYFMNTLYVISLSQPSSRDLDYPIWEVHVPEMNKYIYKKARAVILGVYMKDTF